MYIYIYRYILLPLHLPPPLVGGGVGRESTHELTHDYVVEAWCIDCIILL